MRKIERTTNNCTRAARINEAEKEKPHKKKTDRKESAGW
jgi:hypothetical protein